MAYDTSTWVKFIDELIKQVKPFEGPAMISIMKEEVEDLVRKSGKSFETAKQVVLTRYSSPQGKKELLRRAKQRVLIEKSDLIVAAATAAGFGTLAALELASGGNWIDKFLDQFVPE